MNSFIKELLKKNNLRQNELANILGISSAAVNQWGSTSNIKPELLYNISKLFNISIDDLLKEKFRDETIEEKCDRLYNLPYYEDIKGVITERKKEKLYDFTLKLRNINGRLFELSYLKMIEKITVDEMFELDYIDPYMQVQIYNSPYFYDYTRNCFWKDSNERDLFICNRIKEHINVNEKEEFIWELKKIYFCKKRINWWEDVVNNQEFKTLFTDEIIENIFLSMDKITLDTITTSYSDSGPGNINMCEWLLAIGANIRYENIYQYSICDMYSFDTKELEEFEGEKILVEELGEVKSLLQSSMNNVYKLNYQDYKKIINKNREKYIKWAKYEKSNPLKYWNEYFKNEMFF